MPKYVFVGPTIPVSEASAVVDAIFLPPAAQGDIYRIARQRPLAIGLLDGYFEREPAVWHKEILWAISNGVEVYGAASMGALRAAELAPFGMIGVGKIFERYRDGLLEDDDEVAVAHGPKELAYRRSSDAMVNIRFSLEAAEQAGIVNANTRIVLERFAKNTFYPHRSFRGMLTCYRDVYGDDPAILELRDWLQAHAVDQKGLDARLMLAEMSKYNERPKSDAFHFEHTIFWDDVVSTAEMTNKNGERDLIDDLIIDELRLEPASYPFAYSTTLLRILAADEALRHGAVGSEVPNDPLGRFLSRHGITQDDLPSWLQEQFLEHRHLEALLDQDALAFHTAESMTKAVRQGIIDWLKFSGSYSRLRARANLKRESLSNAGLLNASLYEAVVKPLELLEWYFEMKHIPMPPDVNAFIETNGYRDGEEFLHSLIQEYRFVELAKPPSDDGVSIQ